MMAFACDNGPIVIIDAKVKAGAGGEMSVVPLGRAVDAGLGPFRGRTPSCDHVPLDTSRQSVCVDPFLRGSASTSGSCIGRRSVAVGKNDAGDVLAVREIYDDPVNLTTEVTECGVSNSCQVFV